MIPRYINKPLLLLTIFLLALSSQAFSAPLKPYLLANKALSQNIKPSDAFGLSSFNNNVITIGLNQFDLINQSISKSNYSEDSLIKPKTIAQSFTIQNWDNQYLPILNGIPLKVNGKSLAISISEDEKTFFIISDIEKVLFSESGHVIWKRVSSGQAIKSIITPDKKHIITQYSSGLIEWYDYHDGHTHFSLYVDPDMHNWIIWSPNGYYNSSSPHFFPVVFNSKDNMSVNLAQLQETLYQPAYIQSLIIGNAPQATDSKLDISRLTPPHISFISKNNVIESTDLKLCVKLEEKSPVDVVFALSEVTIQRIHYPASEFLTDATCSLIINFPRPQLDGEEKVLSVRAYDLNNKVWSSTVYKYLYPLQKAEKKSTVDVLITNSLDKRYKNEELISKTLKSANVRKPHFSKVSKLNGNTANTSSAPFIFYISTTCQIQKDDIVFTDIKTSSPFWSLSALETFLININSDKSLIIIDCVTKTRINDKLTVKKIIDNFISNTGRSLLAQFYSYDQIDKSGLKHTFFIETLLQAIKGESDYNDDQSIDTEELKQFVSETLPVTIFEFTGENGITFKHDNPSEFFILPVQIRD